jgi:hypothetical protein
LEKPLKARYIKYEHVYCAAPNLAISDIRVFGNATGKAPIVPSKFSVKRDIDPRNAFVSWEKVKGATGYNILWGIAKDKLYQTYQIFGDEPSTKEIRALSKGVSYYFAVEAFNESGVSGKSEVVQIK